MKFSLAVLTAMNILISGVGIVSIFLNGRPATNNFDSGVARLAVNEQLANLSFLTPEAKLQISQSCAEQRAGGGLVVGKGEALNHSSLVEGVLMNQKTSFSYQAAVSANCNRYNLNCYNVNSIDVNGSRTLSPRL